MIEEELRTWRDLLHVVDNATDDAHEYLQKDWKDTQRQSSNFKS